MVLTEIQRGYKTNITIARKVGKQAEYMRHNTEQIQQIDTY